MKRFLDQWTGRPAPWWVASAALITLAMLGFRGFGEAGLDWLEGARAQAAATAGGDLSGWWELRPGGMLEALTGLLMLISPLNPEWTVAVTGVMAGVVSTVLVFLVAARLGGGLCGWVAVFFLFTSAPWLGVFTRGDPAAVVVPLVLGLVILWRGPLRPTPWWVRGVGGALCLAVGFLIWPGMALVAAALLLLDLAVPSRGRVSALQGVGAGAEVPLDRLLICLGAVGLLLVMPWAGPSPVEAMGGFIEGFLAAPAEVVLFRGGVYPPARPPWYFGIALALEALPVATAVAILAGMATCGSGHLTERGQRMAQSLAVLAVMMLGLPVVFRGAIPLGADVSVIFLGLAAPLASYGVCRFFTAVLSARAPVLKIRQIAIAVYFLVAASILVEVPRGVVHPEAYRSPLTARIAGWEVASDVPARVEILPWRLVRAVATDTERFWSSGWERHLAAYGEMGLIGPGAVSPDGDRATVYVRPVTAVSAGHRGSFPAVQRPAMPGAEVEVWEHRGRPVFFVDRKAGTR